MFRAARFSPDCPVDEPVKAWIEGRMNWLVQQFGIDRLRTAEVVLPTEDFFPDAYTPSAEGARTVLDRLCEYMDLDPADVELEVYEDRNPVAVQERALTALQGPPGHP